jgi:hypothetical protein
MRGLTNTSFLIRPVSFLKGTFFVDVYYMFLRANIEMNALHVFHDDVSNEPKMIRSSFKSSCIPIQKN